MFADSQREIKIIGIVIEKTSDFDPDTMFDSFNSGDIYKIPNRFLNLLLSSFEISEPGDKLIKPIAIFFE